jgi:type IV secretory pathway VirB2 component (pilin)
MSEDIAVVTVVVAALALLTGRSLYREWRRRQP